VTDKTDKNAAQRGHAFRMVAVSGSVGLVRVSGSSVGARVLLDVDCEEVVPIQSPLPTLLNTHELELELPR
jgi:hypothetical protein